MGRTTPRIGPKTRWLGHGQTLIGSQGYWNETLKALLASAGSKACLGSLPLEQSLSPALLLLASLLLSLASKRCRRNFGGRARQARLAWFLLRGSVLLLQSKKAKPPKLFCSCSCFATLDLKVKTAAFRCWTATAPVLRLTTAAAIFLHTSPVVGWQMKKTQSQFEALLPSYPAWEHENCNAALKLNPSMILIRASSFWDKTLSSVNLRKMPGCTI